MALLIAYVVVTFVFYAPGLGLIVGMIFYAISAFIVFVAYNNASARLRDEDFSGSGEMFDWATATLNRWLFAALYCVIAVLILSLPFVLYGAGFYFKSFSFLSILYILTGILPFLLVCGLLLLCGLMLFRRKLALYGKGVRLLAPTGCRKLNIVQGALIAGSLLPLLGYLFWNWRLGIPSTGDTATRALRFALFAVPQAVLSLVILVVFTLRAKNGHRGMLIITGLRNLGFGITSLIVLVGIRFSYLSGQLFPAAASLVLAAMMFYLLAKYLILRDKQEN
ncbi:MAG: hypothetical protein FWC62_09615 [Firmicutes bacterium]|nr:hypothetical protein [Bacillota bacterium]